MPNTYTLISSNVLASGASSVTFSAIPATYTDLVLRYSTRTDYADYRILGALRFNSDTANNYSNTILSKVDNTVASYRNSNNSFSFNVESDGTLSTSNTFGSGEIYVPSYTASQNKPYSDFTLMENNQNLNQQIQVIADLWRNTAAITSVTLFPGGGANFITGSSFYLYGIKNS